MTAPEMFRCSKNFPHENGDQAVELLLIQEPYSSAWDAKPRCAEHPAAGDIPLLQRMHPGVKCAVVPLEGVR